jgi:hypothetical protein
MKTLDVFGIKKDQVESYVERSEVDGMFLDALNTDRQIIVYGASKQGKTSLVDKHLPYKNNIVVSLTPKYTLIDIYKSALSSMNIEIVSASQSSSGTSNESSISAKFKAMIPFGVGVESGAAIKDKTNKNETVNKEAIEVNLALPNDVAHIISKTKNNDKYIILENFHYLDEEIQREFSFDLRSFLELGINFVILGVWKEKNRLIQFNGDLLERLTEVPVEPWKKEDFRKVIAIGEEKLNIRFSSEIKTKIIDSAFDSIGVVQELLKVTCINSGVTEWSGQLVCIDDISKFNDASTEKAEDYSARHIRALEAISEGRKTTNNPKSNDPKEMPLYLPYYTVKAFLKFNFNDVLDGIKRNVLESRIKELHHRPDDVRAGDMSNLLHNFAKLQSEKFISPPIFDYDKTTKTIRVIDSTFYFFLKNIDCQEVEDNIYDPTKR